MFCILKKYIYLLSFNNIENKQVTKQLVPGNHRKISKREELLDRGSHRRLTAEINRRHEYLEISQIIDRVED